MIDEDAVTGITSNPSIFQKAIARATTTTSRSRRCSTTTDDPREIFFELAVDDVRDACDVLRPVWERDRRAGRLRLARGRPELAHDTDETLEQAIELHERGRPAERLVKIPATMRGPAGDRGLHRRAAVSINITLIFSLERYARGRRGLPARARAARRRRRRPVEGRVGRVVLRLAHRHRGRPAARGARQHGAAGQARDREREARLPALPGGVHRAALGGSRGQGRARAAAAVGVDLDQEPGLPRRDVRRGADRPGHGEHDAARDGRGVPGSRRGARRHGARGRRRGASGCSSELREAGVDYDDVVETLEVEGVREVRRRPSTS